MARTAVSRRKSDGLASSVLRFFQAATSSLRRHGWIWRAIR